ncbi:PTS transporter subunit EIIC [Enterococcus sp. 669A]|uniref:PTS transporter subunit EIIC n=1 Tax=Candidatus Enterococcus moelleringii TaxID=2815325 RepID=A0ABS3LHP2_9ENTE|nr:N-acetylglucosamine-specific PTS transporter subunit IIBC [Enterococcus sp. 669A]MBO1308568.1 PTS transporter subunit EIIC [Enterococcus sp. 669A]
MKTYLQKIGRSIMLPISVLPVASLLMGIGYWIDPAGMEGAGTNAFAIFLIQAGLAIIGKLPMLFAVGIATGMSKDKSGASALSGLVAYLITTTILSPSVVGMLQGVEESLVDPAFGNIENVFVGIICGIVAAELYNRYSDVKLPMAVAFFSGKRFVPILSAGAMLIISGILYLAWPIAYDGLVTFGETIAKMGPIGAGIYGFFNVLLEPIGLHHALNSVFWFDVAGINDIGNFWSNTGVKGVTGMYQAGYFPIYMFGLPAAALAIYRNARPERKKVTASLMLAAGFATFFTGITEPIVFSFLFVAPALLAVHAVLTGLSLFLAATFHFTAGFGFSAGLVDYILSLRMPIANQPLMLIPIGLVMAVIYYFVFSFSIKKFNLMTPGREVDDTIEEDEFTQNNLSGYNIAVLIEGLGGKENIVSIDHCATRLRLVLNDSKAIDEKKIKSTGALATKIIDDKNVQVIIGTNVQFVHDELKENL